MLDLLTAEDTPSLLVGSAEDVGRVIGFEVETDAALACLMWKDEDGQPRRLDLPREASTNLYEKLVTAIEQAPDRYLCNLWEAGTPMRWLGVVPRRDLEIIMIELQAFGLHLFQVEAAWRGCV